MVRVIATIAQLERVHLNVPNANYARIVRETLKGARRPAAPHPLPRDPHQRVLDPRSRAGVRAADAARRAREAAVVDWGFNAWGGKYPPWDADDAVPTRSRRELGLPVFSAGIVMEGGAVDFNGEGSPDHDVVPAEQEPQPGLPKAESSATSRSTTDRTHVVWLGDGIAGDDTDGHVDDLARFVDPRTIVTAVEADPRDENYACSGQPPPSRGRATRTAAFDIVELPMPAPVVHEGQRLPATY